MWNLPAKLIATKDSRKVAEHVLARLKGPDAFLRKVNFLFEHQSEKSLDEIEFKDGRVFDRYSSPLNDSTGKPHGRVLYFRDITERKRAEQAIQESQSRLQIIFDSVQTGIVIIDPETRRIVDVNPVALEMIGAPRDEVVGAECHKFICPAERGRCPVCDLGQSVDNSERILLTACGGRREVIKTVVPVVIGGRQHLWESFIDITQHKRAEAEQIRLVTAIEQSAEAVVITNTNGDIEYVNPAFTRITGYSREEVLGQNPRVLKSGKQDVALYQQLWETILKGEAWHGELINQRKDGSLYTEEMNITPVRVTRGEVTHFIASIQDVTERKSLEGHLQQAAKMEAVGRLAGGVAHDFNNLLTIINGYTELLLGKFASDSKVSVHLKEIEKAGERATSLTRQLLAFSRRQVLAPQVLDLNAVVSNLEKMLRRLIGEDITLRTLLDPSLGKVKADPGQIEQVIMNLAVNARDAMPSGGNLTIETSNVELDEAYARTHATVKPGPHVMLAVADTGLGMTRETKARIFEPFFTTKEKGKGTGLGLATVYGIVKQSGGSIWVYSEVGQGTIFKLYLPIVSESPEAREPAKAAMDSAAGSETILVVEDEEGVRSLIRLALESTGYKVLEMEDAESALAICANHHGPIHLMLTDVVMPQMSGALLAEKVISMRPDIKIVFMSGYTDDAIVRHGVLSHQMPFLQKPFSGVAVCKKIREVLDGK